MANAGRLSLDWIVELLGVGGPVTPLTATIEVLGIILLILTVYLSIRVDWRKITNRDEADSDSTT